MSQHVNLDRDATTQIKTQKPLKIGRAYKKIVSKIFSKDNNASMGGFTRNDYRYNSSKIQTKYVANQVTHRPTTSSLRTGRKKRNERKLSRNSIERQRT